VEILEEEGEEDEEELEEEEKLRSNIIESNEKSEIISFNQSEETLL